MHRKYLIQNYYATYRSSMMNLMDLAQATENSGLNFNHAFTINKSILK